ncbi:MAG: tetratricopeptide repeat protein [Flavobacteriales bacterium]|nr:tetratricopeptide repeat protein [Flavobacteriales bacterium]
MITARALRSLLTALLGAWMAVAAQAQGGTDEQLAAQYFQRGEYDKAALYYDKLYRSQPSEYYYEQLFRCQVSLKDYESAEKLAKDQLRRQNGDPRYIVDLGSVYRAQGDDDKAMQQFQKALKGMKYDQASVRNLANAFSKYNELDLALEAYERGQNGLKDGTNFHYEIATIYAAKGDVPAMVKQYIDLLGANESYIQAVQNGLARYIDFSVADSRSETLRTELLRHIQKDPQKTIYQELLIWMYIQQKDLTSALVQSKAMDKRFGEGGQRVMELAEVAVTNEDWSTAVKCYQYVVTLGSEGPNYLRARIGEVNTLDRQLTAQAEPAREELVTLQQKYEVTISELGRSRGTLELVRGLARLKAYYLNDAPGAITLLEEGIATPGADPKSQAEMKLDLGDIHVLNANIWEASLLYSQVDLDFKQDMLGHEARLRNAKVSFYAGDFLWAQGQLDVLKASTSKLIANDAMELSLLISDNLGADSNSVPLSMYAHAQLFSFQHRYDEALTELDSLTLTYPMHSISDEVFMERFRIAYARHQYDSAAVWLVKITEQYPNDILMDNALIELGRLYDTKLKDPEKAKQYYERLLFEQGGSIFVPEARDRFRRLRGDMDGPQTPEQKFLNGEAP